MVLKWASATDKRAMRVPRIEISVVMIPGSGVDTSEIKRFRFRAWIAISAIDNHPRPRVLEKKMTEFGGFGTGECS